MAMNCFRFYIPAIAMAALLCFSATSPAGHQDDQQKLPAAAEVLKKFAESTGGAQKYREIKSVKMTGTMSVPDQGLSGTINIQMVVPNKQFVKVEVPDVFNETKGSDGTIAWSSNSMMGPRVLEGKEKDDLLAESNFEKIYNPEKFYKEMEVVGIKEIDGESCYELKLTKKNGLVETQCFSQKTGLHVGSESIVATQMGDLNVEVSLSEYKEVGGIKFPHKIDQKVSGTKVTVQFDSIEVNPEIAASTFEVPAEVKALITDGDDQDKEEGAGK